MKKVLYFYPHKFSDLTDGSHVRAVSLLQFFKSRGFQVDMISFDHPEVKKSYVLEHNLVNSLHLVNDNPFIQEVPARNGSSINLLFRRAGNLIRKLLPGSLDRKPAGKTRLPDFTPVDLAAKVADLLARENYHAILIAYSYWSPLLKSLDIRHAPIKKVLDPNDFLTLQQFYGNDQLRYDEVGNMFGDELERLSNFDDILHISYDELLLFSNFVPGKRHHYIPQFFEQKKQSHIASNKNYDILFIGSKNAFNREGSDWFFNEVYPLLPKTFSIAIAGTVGEKKHVRHDNVHVLGFVDNINALYSSSRCTICPLLRGSGMKIKVIESLAYGLPVVSTSKGIDGFFNKDVTEGILVADEPHIFARHLTRLINDDDYYVLQSARARGLFEQYFSKEINNRKLDGIFA